MNRKVTDYLLLLAAIALAVAVFLYFQASRQEPQGAGDAGQVSNQPKQQVTAPIPKKHRQQAPAAPSQPSDTSSKKREPVPSGQPADAGQPGQPDRSGKQEQQVRTTKAAASKHLEVPKEYPVEEAAKYYLPPEQRSPGNLGGPPPPPPLALPGMMPPPPEADN